MWNSGASIAACRSRPRRTWRRKTCSDHWSCWSPPGVPNARYGSPSRRASQATASSADACAERARWQPLLEPEHLRARPERPAQLGDHRRALEPPAARRRRDELPTLSTTSTWHRVAGGVGSPAPTRVRAPSRTAPSRRGAPPPAGAELDRRRPPRRIPALLVTRGRATARAGRRRSRDPRRTPRDRRKRAWRTPSTPVDEFHRRQVAEVEGRRAARAAAGRLALAPTAPSCRPCAPRSRR